MKQLALKGKYTAAEELRERGQQLISSLQNQVGAAVKEIAETGRLHTANELVAKLHAAKPRVPERKTLALNCGYNIHGVLTQNHYILIAGEVFGKPIRRMITSNIVALAVWVYSTNINSKE